jgi:bacteriocin-like protein
MERKDNREQTQLTRKLTLHRETVRVLTDKELNAVAGGAGGGNHASNANTCACGTCGHLQSTCFGP